MYRATVRTPGGYALILDPDLPGGKDEADTVTCGHCGALVVISGSHGPQGGGCYQCGAALCPACVDAGVCLPFEAWLDRTEGRPLRGRWAEDYATFRARRIGG